MISKFRRSLYRSVISYELYGSVSCPWPRSSIALVSHYRRPSIILPSRHLAGNKRTIIIISVYTCYFVCLSTMVIIMIIIICSRFYFETLNCTFWNLHCCPEDTPTHILRPIWMLSNGITENYISPPLKYFHHSLRETTLPTIPLRAQITVLWWLNHHSHKDENK